MYDWLYNMLSDRLPAGHEDLVISGSILLVLMLIGFFMYLISRLLK